MQNPETLSRSELEQLQLERLQSSLFRLQQNVALYRDRFREQKIDVEKIRSIKDLRELPFTTRADLDTAYPYGLFAVPLRDIVRLHASSGTTGKPVVTGYTRNDIKHWTELVARLLRWAGVHEEDTLLNAFHYSLFTGGLGFHYGAEAVGASVVPASESGDLRRQLQIMRDYKATVLSSTPSYVLRLIQGLAAEGVHAQSLHLRVGLFGAEPWCESTRQRIQEALGIKAYDSYGLSEVMGPGVAGECVHQKGLHLHEDHFIAEIVHPETGAPLEDGEEGELVLTTLTKEGFPLIRYRTGDRTTLLPDVCPCGRSFRRMDRVSGRTDDLVIIRGVKISPARMEAVLSDVSGVTPYWTIHILEKNGIDEMEIRVGISDALPFFDEVKKLEQLKEKLIARVRRELNVSARLHFVEPDSLQKGQSGKVVRIVDERRSCA